MADQHEHKPNDAVILDLAEARATKLLGPPMPLGEGACGMWGSASEHERYAEEAPNRRRRCHCGCRGATTHIGMANGVALTSGCELYVRRWVRA